MMLSAEKLQSVQYIIGGREGREGFRSKYLLLLNNKQIVLDITLFYCREQLQTH